MQLIRLALVSPPRKNGQPLYLTPVATSIYLLFSNMWYGSQLTSLHMLEKYLVICLIGCNFQLTYNERLIVLIKRSSDV